MEVINKDTVKKIAYTVLWVLILWLGIKYALKWVAPFVLALLTARLMEGSVKQMSARFGLRRGITSAICSALILAALGSVLALVVTRLAVYIGDFISSLPELLEEVDSLVVSIREKMEGALDSGASEGVLEMETAMLDGIYDLLKELPQRVSKWALATVSSAASAAPRYFMFVLTYIISVFFFSAGYPDVTKFIMRQIPKKWHQKFMGVKGDFFHTLGKWFKAQFTMMCITFAELIVVFTILRVPYAILIAAAVALVDAMPVLGTGTVLIPWAIISLVSGEATRGIGLAVAYGVVSIVRSVVEPRLVGRQMGLPAVVTLMAIYIGFCTIGIWGMILFPIGVMVIKQLNDSGYVNLWK